MSITFYLTLLAVVAVLDIYVFRSYRFMVSGLFRNRFVLVYWFFSGVVYFTLAAYMLSNYHKWPGHFRITLIAVSQAVIICKIVVAPFLLIDDLQRFVQGLWHTIRPKAVPTHGGQIISRAKFLHTTGWLLAGFALANIAWGVTRTAYQYTIRKVGLKLPNLPASFDGLKIVQISDLHLGSFAGTTAVQKMVGMINEQEPDLVFFTGDLVNNFAYEAEPFLEVLNGISAKKGVYSVLGNHDYGEYTKWESEQAKALNHANIVDIQRQFGWRVLRNEHILLDSEEGNIAIIGVENWGTHFYKYGDIAKATLGAESAAVKILLSHDPSHWDAVVSKEFTDINLTLSGHTHGFQFGVEIPDWGIKWGAGQALYKYWAGLYQMGTQYLYVNRGAGFIGFPGRVGIRPEITLITLNSGSGLMD
jgi:uncharacterized protein